MEPIDHLLPSTVDLQLDGLWVDEHERAIVLELSSIQAVALCPCCSLPSTRIHSRYLRRVGDLPWADFTVRLRLKARRLRCDNVLCARQIFCERLPSTVAPWARKTHRLHERQYHIAMALGGMAGARLSEQVGCTTSRNTLLRAIRSAANPLAPAPCALGIDDWAICKGRTYGTILVDLENGRAVELLPDREADTLAAWLRLHPGVEIIARDRAGAYADGARRGAPSAIQVADRFHLVHNLIDVLQQVFERHRGELTVPAAEASGDRVVAEQAQLPRLERRETSVAVAPVRSEKGWARLLHFKAARQLHAAGWTKSAIARHLRIGRHTVRRYVEADAFSDRRQASKLDPYKPYIIDRWNAGCRTGKQLLEEIMQQGYRGGRSTAYAYVTRLRQAQGLPPRSRMLQPGHALRDADAYRLTPRQAAFLMLRRPEHVPEQTRRVIDHLEHAHPALQEALMLAKGETVYRIGSVVEAAEGERIVFEGIEAWRGSARPS